jgi:hypothetical protein
MKKETILIPLANMVFTYIFYLIFLKFDLSVQTRAIVIFVSVIILNIILKRLV